MHIWAFYQVFKNFKATKKAKLKVTKLLQKCGRSGGQLTNRTHQDKSVFIVIKKRYVDQKIIQMHSLCFARMNSLFSCCRLHHDNLQRHFRKPCCLFVCVAKQQLQHTGTNANHIGSQNLNKFFSLFLDFQVGMTIYILKLQVDIFK